MTISWKVLGLIVLVVLIVGGGAYYANQQFFADTESTDELTDEAASTDGARGGTDETVASSCPFPVTDVPELAASYGVPEGWIAERENGTIAIMEDDRNLTAAFIYTAKLERDLSAEEFLAEFGEIFRVTIEDAGGSFSLGTSSNVGDTSTATAKATVEEGDLAGTFTTTKEPGFVTFNAYWAPTDELSSKEAKLKDVVGCFVRSTALTDEQLAAATNARGSGSSTGSGSTAWGPLVAGSEGQFTYTAPASWTPNVSSSQGESPATSLVIDAPASDASVAFLYNLGRYGVTDTEAFARTTMSLSYSIEATLSGKQSVGDGVDAYDFEGTFGGKPVRGAVSVKVEPYQTFFAHYLGVQIANADKWDAYASTLNAIQSSIRLTDAGQELSSLPALPNYSTENLFGSTGSGSSVTSGSRYQDEVSDRSSQKWADAMRGYEEVESPTTGQRYDAPLNSWNSTGPDGGGYYRQLPGGGGLEKLDQVTP